MTEPLPKFNLAAVAQVLAELSAEIEALGTVLCTDASFAMNHVEELQAIDLIAQNLRSLGHLLEADRPNTALAGVGLEGLVSRLCKLAASTAEAGGH